MEPAAISRCSVVWEILPPPLRLLWEEDGWIDTTTVSVGSVSASKPTVGLEVVVGVTVMVTSSW